MKLSRYTIMTAILLGAYLLSACSGAPAPSSVMDDSGNGQFQEVVFTGTVESVGGNEWQISGQQVPVDSSTMIDANIQVGDTVRVEASVSPDGSVVALKIESSSADDGNSNTNANSNDDNANDGNSNDGNTNDNNSNSNTNENSNDGMSGSESEVYGVVEAITSDSITIDGVTYILADFTEFNDLIAVGDQVEIHVIVNADGTITISEIELSTSIDDNSNDDNSNVNGSDDNSNDNGNDDNSNDNSNDDDDDDDDNSNSNSNADDDDDDDSNDNSNSNGS